MSQLDSTPPEVLVMGGGGVLGEAWLSALLAGIAAGRGFDARQAGAFIGTSAGSIVAASLAGGIDPADRLELSTAGFSTGRPGEAGARGRLPSALAAALQAGEAAAAPLASFALSSSAAGGALMRRAMLRRVPAGERSLGELGRMIDAAGVRFDGRLRIAAVELGSGRRVMFGAPGSPPCTVAQAVLASCAIPGVFAPITIDGRAYVDGGAWSPTNMDAAEIERGDCVLCLNPTGSLRPTVAAPAGAIGPISRTLSNGEALALRHRGAKVRTINPDGASSEAMGVNLMDPNRRQAVIAAAHAQGLRLAGQSSTRAA
jgi:NTE family protein